MDKRLQKRHARQVARAREKVKVSEPDVRTPEEIEAARQASHAIRSRTDFPHTPYVTPPGETAKEEETPTKQEE